MFCVRTQIHHYSDGRGSSPKSI